MKRGKTVAVCYDGKSGRRVPGVVTETRRGHHIKVRFKPWGVDEAPEVEAWFRRDRPRRYFTAFVESENALMPALFSAPGDFYSVYRWPRNEQA